MIPLTIIGGYLGAGKTTLINHILRGGHGKRLAVLVNDFGEINIDASLIVSHDGDTISLANGCVCCSIADALGDALDKVMESVSGLEHIVLETSGVADPGKIANYGRGWPGLSLDAVVTVAGADTIEQLARDKFVGRLVRQQIQACDILVLNRADLLDAERLAGVQAWAAQIAPGVPVFPTAHGNVPLAMMLGSGLAQSQAIPARSFSFDAVAPDAGDLFKSFTFRDSGVFDRDPFAAWAGSLPHDIWRAKGHVRFSDEPGDCYLFQKVGRRWELSLLSGGSAPSQEGVAIALVGHAHAIDAAGLSQSLSGALAAAEAAPGSPATA